MFSKIFSFLKHRPLQVLLVLTLYFFTVEYIPYIVQEGFYTVSLFIKELLMWFIPVTVAMYIANTVKSFKKRAPIFILILAIFEASSNFASVWYAYFTAGLVSRSVDTLHVVSTTSDFTYLWKIPFSRPEWLSPDKGMIVGIILGCIAAYRSDSIINNIIKRGSYIVELILTKVFSRLIPVFILGFAAQMYQMQLLTRIFKNYSFLVSWLLIFLGLYILLLFFVGAGGSIRKTITHIKNLLPAGMIALSSGCSLSTLPWTIKGAAQNLQNPFFAKAIIPATTNIQQIGDAIVNTFLCFIIYKNFNSHNPDLWMWLQFSLVFIIARFATAAVMGGAIFIMLPIYEQYLNFNAEMIAVILALNVILDPVVTSTNVMANGALCKIFEDVWLGFQKISDRLSSKKLSLS
jgi:Na+/H+-dicarboxylate symporter